MDNALDLLDRIDTRELSRRVVRATITAASDDVAQLTTDGGVDARLPVSEFPPGHRFTIGQRYTLLKIADEPRPTLSAAAPELVEALVMGIVPEIRRGEVRVMAVARLAGTRTKVAVAATGPGVDPVAACIGRRANRVKALARELGGERIDVVAWHHDPATFLANAFAPAKVTVARIGEGKATVTAPRHQMSAAVGGGGLNAALAGQLCGVHVSVEEEGVDQTLAATAAAEDGEGDEPVLPS